MTLILPFIVATLLKQPQIDKPVVRQVIVQAPETVVQPPPVTAADNPNHCTDNQWIAAEQPFYCITKEIPTPPSKPVETTVQGCGDNQWANFIYMHESGCNTSSINSIGCRGIGQACPGSKLPCGADYACQNTWFSNYANSVYGGWQQAYNFWLGHSWW